MINFNKNSVFNLKPIAVADVRGEVLGLLVPGEEILCAFKTLRDQLIFTSKRVISVDVQGLTGTRKSFSSLPYSKVQYFAVQTPSVMEMVPDSELVLVFASGMEARFEFKGNVDVGLIGRMISEYVLA